MQSKVTNKETTTRSTIKNMFSRDKRSNNINDNGNPNIVDEWELRPGGMLVQKRNSDVNNKTSTIKVKVKYGSSYYQIHISSHASFGELKKMLTEYTGLHVLDQKLIFKKKVRDSKSYLDVERVKDGSKLVLIEDIESRERRILETLKIAKKEKTSKSLIEINLEVDKLSKKVSALEGVASTGGVIENLDVESLTESLMRILITLDEIYYGEGELKLKRKEQVRRVQKHIETLDMLKMTKAKENNMAHDDDDKSKVHCGVEKQQECKKQEQHYESVVVTTKWETFD
ncbi:BAG family molecular chaperone regulator 1-like isoform X2 [Cicer arietinum]|uniref:BAG family molecular chaperone regulator 1-like isoform X2 n=1 Tax=Cicer arietinum TaxID=3827 RepID=A0A1S2Z687_CICAR|nr:BAG family molecular chaperone regulator 1-like isoform X2 [Cicer arietinum]